jgi:LPXTG-motif cell wall-anchored protein
MKKILIAVLLIITQNTFAQITSQELTNELASLVKKIELLENKSNNQEKEMSSLMKKFEILENKAANQAIQMVDLNLKLSVANKQVDSLKNKTNANQIEISKTKTDLANEITQSGLASDSKIASVSKDLSKNSLYGIIGVLLAVLLSGVLFFFWKRRQDNDKSELTNKLDNSKVELNKEIQNTKSSLSTLEQKLFEEYNKQVAGIEQLSLSISEMNKGKSPDSIKEQDHSLTLKVADEVTRINAFANTLDPTKQEAIALKSSVKRIIDNFKANKYEIVDLLGQKYDDRLNIIVVGESIDSALNSGEEKITKIIKPLVKFNGEQIQAAQVEISIGQ